MVAIVGFAIGVVWPRLFGWQLGPAPPQEGRPAAMSSAGPAKEKASPATPLPAMSAGAAAMDTRAPSNETTVVVSAVEIGKCRDLKGKTPDKCDEPALDPLFVPRLKELAKCPSGIGLLGKVQVGFDLDFKHKTIKVQRAKGKLPRTTIDGITKCAERGLAGVSLDDLTHEQNRYSASYTLSFYPPGKSPEKDGETTAPAPDKDKDKDKPAEAGDAKSAEVQWKSTQVRDAPKTGTVVGKLTKGAKVTLLDQKDGWYHIEFGDPKRQGWVFREALGLLARCAPARRRRARRLPRATRPDRGSRTRAELAERARFPGVWGRSAPP